MLKDYYYTFKFYFSLHVVNNGNGNQILIDKYISNSTGHYGCLSLSFVYW